MTRILNEGGTGFVAGAISCSLPAIRAIRGSTILFLDWVIVRGWKCSVPQVWFGLIWFERAGGVGHVLHFSRGNPLRWLCQGGMVA